MHEKRIIIDLNTIISLPRLFLNNKTYYCSISFINEFYLCDITRMNLSNFNYEFLNFHDYKSSRIKNFSIFKQLKALRIKKVRISTQ